MMKFCVVIALLFGVVSAGFSQIEDPKIDKAENEIPRAIVVVYTKTGEIYKGFFISQDKDFLVIENETVGKITIPTNRIKKIESADSNGKIKLDDDSAEVTNINSSRYFFGSSGFNFEKGGNYLSNNVTAYYRGISDNFSIGVGTILVTLVAGFPIFYVNPHYTYSFNEKLHFKTGVDAFIGFADGESGVAALLNAGLTVGTPDLNLTGTIYYGAVSGLGVANQPAFTLAGSARISRKLALVSENVLLANIDSEGYFIGTYGIRYMTPSASYDLFFFNNRDIAEQFVIGIPFIGFTLKL